jgi:hypothetical protein
LAADELTSNMPTERLLVATQVGLEPGLKLEELLGQGHATESTSLQGH